jgi:hypothetical protein
MIDSYGADKVFVIISKRGVKRETEKGLFVVMPETSEMIWNKYIDENGYKGKIIVNVSSFPSPIVDTYEMLKEFPAGTTVLVSKGEKDAEDPRFSRMQQFIEKNNLPVRAEMVDGSMSDTGASGTKLGLAVADGDFETFKKMVPLSGASAMDLWEELTSQVIDEDNGASLGALFEMIDEAINIDNNPVPDGQLGGPQRTGEEDSTEDEESETEKSNKKGGESNTEVEVTTKTVVNVSVNGNDVSVTTNEGSEEEETKEVISEESEEPAERGIINLDFGMGLSRMELPQIKSTDVPEFVEWLDSKDIDSVRTSMEVGELTPVQKEINLDKTGSMAAKHGSGEIDLSKGKPVMVSGDEYLVDGHHRWYALRELDPNNKLDVIMIDAPILDLLSLMKEFPKTSYKSPVDEMSIEPVINESYGKISDGGASVINVGKMKIVIDVEDMDLEPSKHGEERRFRHGKGKTISKDSILQAAERGLGLVIQDYANGEIGNGEAFVIRHKANSKTPALNIVAALEMKKGPDTMKIITVMRKDDFKTDNFGGGSQKTYNV